MVPARGRQAARTLGALVAGGVMLGGCARGPQLAGPATYSRDLAPILFTHCAPCHHDGGSAPFSVLDYQAVRAHGRQITTMTASRRMPPWLPEKGVGEFAGERRLDDAQIDTIRRWAEAGMAEGDRRDLPPVPQFSGGWQLGEPDLIVKLPHPYTLPAASEDVFRNFVIPLPINEPHDVTTVEIRPGSTRFVHHGLLAIDETRSSRRRAEEEGDTSFPGMDMGAAHMPEGTLLGWSPGMLPFPGVEGSTWRLNPRTDLVLQLHMMPADSPQTLDPVIGFHFAKAPGAGPPTDVIMLDADWALDIPAGASDFSVGDEIQLPVDVELLVVYPHAHYLGKSIEAWATLPDGSRRSLLRIPRWDFKWQDVYRLAQPMPLPKGTTIAMRWTYDNSAEGHSHHMTGAPRRVVAGNRTTDEMAHLQLQVRVRQPEDRLRLQEAYFRYLLRRNPANAKFLYGLGSALKDQRRWTEAAAAYQAALAIDPRYVMAHNNFGAVLLEQDKIPDAIRQFEAAVRIDPEFSGAHYNLGLAFAAAGQLANAIAQYREALRYEPSFAEAHANLGQLLGSQGNLAEAIPHLRESVRLMPRSAEAMTNLGIALWLQGHRDEAISSFRRALELDPQHAGARHNLEAALKQTAGASQ